MFAQYLVTPITNLFHENTNLKVKYSLNIPKYFLHLKIFSQNKEVKILFQNSIRERFPNEVSCKIYNIDTFSKYTTPLFSNLKEF